MDKTALYSKAFLESIQGLPEKKVLPALLRFKEVLKNREESHLYPRILRNIIASIEYREIATITSARELDKKLQNSVIKMIRKNFPDLSKEYIRFNVDEKMLGGISISYRDQRV